MKKTIKFQTEHISKLIIELNEVSSKLVMESVINDNKEEIIYWRSKYEELSRQIDNLKMEKAVLENNISKKSSDQIVEIEEYKNNLKKMNSLLNENNILMEKSKKIVMDYENMSNQYNKILKEQENSIKILSSTIMRERGDDVEIGHSLYLNVPNESILDEKIKIILQKQDEIEIENKKLMNTIKKNER